MFRFLQEKDYDIWADDDGLVKAGPKAANVVQTVGVTLSLLAALAVAMELIADQRAGAGTTVTRVLLGIMTGIILMSMARVFGTLPIPQEYEEGYDWGAKGNTATCTLQGSAVYVGTLLIGLYDIALSITYVLMIKCNWSSISLRKMERIVHFLSTLIVLAAWIGALVTRSFNRYLHFCTLSAMPSLCGGEGQVACERGEISYMFDALWQALLVAAVLISAVSMTILYCTVRKLEQQNQRYATYAADSTNLSSNISLNTNNNNITSSNNNNARANRRSRQVAIQAIFYVSTLLVAGAPQVINDLLWLTAGIWSGPVNGVTTFLSSVMGVLYLFVFLRMRQEMRTTYGCCVRAIFSWLSSWLCCCCGKRGESQGADRQQTTASFAKDRLPKSGDSPQRTFPTTTSSSDKLGGTDETKQTKDVTHNTPEQHC